MSKPVAGTLIGTNSFTVAMSAAYLLNGSDSTNLVNSVGGGEPLTTAVSGGAGMTYDSGTDSLVFDGSNYLGLPLGNELCNAITFPELTILIGFKATAPPSYANLWVMEQGGIDQDFTPYVNGDIYTSALFAPLPAASVRYQFTPPTTAFFTAFNQVGVTGLASGNVLFYINGVLANTAAAPNHVGVGPGNIGHNAGANFLGNIQFFYAWKRVLTPAELAALAADPYGPIFTSSLTAQTITFPAIPNHWLGDASFALAATASSGLPVSYAVTSGTATVSGNIVTLTGSLGSVTIQATQAGNATYVAATPVNQTFNVTTPSRPISPISPTFGSWNIIPMPASPSPASMEYTAEDTVAISVSPFTGQQQVQDWQASFLEASVSMPPLTHVQAQQWIAFLMSLRGQANVFQLGDPLAIAPLGSGLGAPVVDGGAQNGYSIYLRGFTPGAAGVLLPGDWLQIGYRLYRTLLAVSADGTGRVVLSIWPQLRESPVDGTAVVLNNTKGLWRLQANTRKWSITAARVYGMQFEIREAL